MQSTAALTTGTVSLAVTIVVGWLWVTAYFVTQDQADDIHFRLANDIKETYYEVKIDAANAELTFIELEGVKPEEQRQYDLRSFEVQFMTKKLAELNR